MSGWKNSDYSYDYAFCKTTTASNGGALGAWWGGCREGPMYKAGYGDKFGNNQYDEEESATASCVNNGDSKKAEKPLGDLGHGSSGGAWVYSENGNYYQFSGVSTGGSGVQYGPQWDSSTKKLYTYIKGQTCGRQV